MRWWRTALFMVTSCLAVTQAIAERRVALVVGNSQYAYASTLPNPRNDAEDIATVLGEVGFEVTVGYDLDQVKFAVTVAQFARSLEGADVGLFFYAGHGLQIDGKNYLVSTQAKLENTFLVSSEAMELDNIMRMMESKAGISLIFLDACRNNPLADNLKRNIAAVNRALTVGRGLARIAPGRDTLIAFSAASDEVAADGSGRNSPFAASLLRHLTQPGLEISVMLKEVTADVRQATNNVQRPQQFSDMSKTFYFVKAEQAAAAPPPTPLASPPVAPVDPVELAFWQSASGANECESMRSYLRQYPDGRFAALGRVSEHRLCNVGPEVAVQQAPPPPPAASPATASVPRPVSAPDLPPAASGATAPAELLPLATSAARTTVVPAIARRLQTELVRVGCAPPGMETDGTWGATAWREVLRQFNERTHAIAALDQPTPQALLEAVQSHKDRVCPLTCEPGTEPRGGSCVDEHKERPRHTARPSGRERVPERERPPRAQRSGEPRRADSGPRPPPPSQFSAPAVRDCVHVAFPQCSPR